ncbi:MAG: hypothetical protein V5A72_01885 [Candidatus Nanohaloarchaea archaeon]
MESETEIIGEERFEAEDIIRYGEKVSESVYKDVYRRDNEVLKVLKGDTQTDEMKRLGTFLPENLIPSTLARTEDLSKTRPYNGEHTVVYQESYDERMDEILKKSETYEELGDLIHLLDRIVEEDAMMSDPIIENFNYFGKGSTTLGSSLKPSDICDIESMKKFPHSFKRPEIETSFYEQIEKMYEEAIISVNYGTDLEMTETAEIFENTSRHVRQVDLEPKLSLDEWPKVEVFPQ